MHVSQERFNLTPTERRGVDDFLEYLWYSSEVCSHCFTRVREIDERKITRGKNGHIQDTWEFHERTEHARNEHTPWDRNKRFGTTFCLECGSDTSAHHRDMELEELKPIAQNIYRYTTKHTPLELDHERFGREIRAMKTDPDYQGKESQILAVAFARAKE